MAENDPAQTEIPANVTRLQLPLRSERPLPPPEPEHAPEVSEWLRSATRHLWDTTVHPGTARSRDFGNNRIGDGSAQLSSYAKELHAVVKEILRNIQDQSDWTVPVMIALGRQVYEVATRVELIYTRGTPVSAWTPRRRTAQLHRLKSMMAITQQWLTLLLAHIDWVGQSERIHAALGTLNQLTGPSSSVMMHLVVTRAAVQHVKQKAEGLRDRKLYEASKRAIVLMLESTSALSSRDEDADISALQEVSLLLQTKLTSGFGRIQQHLHDMNHAYDRLAADILWEDAVPEIVYAIREAAGISKEGNNGEAVHTREVQDTQAGPPENLDSFISRICAARLLDCGASPQKSSFYPASTDDRTTTLSDGFFWSLALTMLAAAFLPFMRSLQSFVCSFLVFASVFYSSQFSSPPSCDALTAFFCENTLHLWLRRQLSEQSTGTDASKSQWYCKDTSLSM